MVRSFDLKYSERKSIAISVRPDGKVTVRAPSGMPYRDIKAFVESKENWIRNAIDKYKTASGEQNTLSLYDIEQLKEKTRLLIEPKVKKYAGIIGVTYGEIKIGRAKTRWGSCSSNGNLNFNCLLALVPDRVVDSVVVHELCHRKHMDHSDGFYRQVYAAMPDYEIHHAWLRKNGAGLIARLYNIKED
ncbi:MAG: M48 family metallopeptidase [Clostridiales bacterium]|nr:M48 family metallopeptidase [Clostridiales bacterium]